MNDTTALTQWDPNTGAALPAYLADAAAAFGGSNIPDRQTVPSLSYEGKVWTVAIAGNKTKMTRTNEDGDIEPVNTMRVVILNANNERGRAYYPGVYNPQAVAAPKCWSADGKTPDPSVREKEASACATCPQSVKGSKIQDGREMVACSQHRLLAIAPAFDLAHEPLRLKIAVTSDWDKDVVEHGWFAFRQYLDYLKSRGIMHTGMVVTKIKFDPNTAFVKLLFALDRPLTPAELSQAVAASQNPKVATLLSEKWTPAGVNGTPTDDGDIAPDARPKPTDPQHIHAAGTDGELWWSELETSWVKPWPVAPEAPPVPAAAAVIEGTATVVADPEPPAPAPAAPEAAPKPTDPGHIAHAGTPNELWWNGSDWVQPWIAEAPAAPEPASPPPPEPAAPPVVPKPTDPGHIAHAGTPNELWWNGSEWVQPWEVGNAVSAVTAPSSAPATTPERGSQTSASGPTAATVASLSSGELPDEVKSVLGKWTS